MRILAIGDVTSPLGLSHLAKNLWKYREENKIDFVIVNGENASFITGISEEGAVKLLRGGADCITGGNHTLKNRKVYTYIEEESAILRPIIAAPFKSNIEGSPTRTVGLVLIILGSLMGVSG